MEVASAEGRAAQVRPAQRRIVEDRVAQQDVDEGRSHEGGRRPGSCAAGRDRSPRRAGQVGAVELDAMQVKTDQGLARRGRIES